MSKFLDEFGGTFGLIFERDVYKKGLTMADVDEALALKEIDECKMDIPEGRAFSIGVKSVFDVDCDMTYCAVATLDDYMRYYLGDNFEYGVITGTQCQNVFGFITQQFFYFDIKSVFILENKDLNLKFGGLSLSKLCSDDACLKNPYEFMLADALNACPVRCFDWSEDELVNRLVTFDRAKLDFEFTKSLVSGVDAKMFLERCKNATQ